MGLLAKVEKKSIKKEIPVEKHVAIVKEIIEEKIKKQEIKGIKKPKVAIAQDKIHVQRPEGTAKKIKTEAKEETVDLSKIKDQIQAEIKGALKPEEKKLEEQEKKIEKEEKKIEKEEKKLEKEEKKIEQEEKKLEEGVLDLSKIKAEIESELKGGKKQKQEAIPAVKGRVPTGIPGLDEAMGGGFRRKTVVLVGGGPGTGKTIFAMQFLMNGIEEYDEPGVYISFEQTEKEIIEDMGVFGWDIEEKIKNKKLVVLTYTPEQVEKVLKAGGGTVRDVIESSKAKRVVIDSLTAFTLLHENALAQRKAVIALFQAIKKWGCTAMLISEQAEDPESHGATTVEEFEVDGVVLLYNIKKGDVRERALEIFKMRATKHSAKLFPMTIDDNGITIYPDQTVF